MKIIICSFLFVSLSLNIRAQSGQIIHSISGNHIYFESKDSLLLEGMQDPNYQLIAIVFHAEKDTIGLDPGLSTEGRWRAIHLLNLLKPLKPQEFLSTPFRMNILTLQPLTDYFQKMVVYYDQADLKSLLKTVESFEKKPIVLVAHPETFGLIFEALTTKQYTDSISGVLSDRLILIQRKHNREVKYWTFRYNSR
jgi:hypothetical protein